MDRRGGSTGIRPLMIASALAGLAGAGLGWGVPRLVRERITATRISPDETLRALVVETSPAWATDRMVQIRLESLVAGTTTLLFHSPDEGNPAGTERLIWSRDGTILLVVGRHFFVKDDLFLDNGDQLYFLHHVPSGRSWSNAAGESKLPPLKADQVRGVEFTEPVILRGG